MIPLIPAATIAVAILYIVGAPAAAQAEGAAPSETAAAKTNLRESPITPGFWQFASTRIANSNEIAQGCRDFVTFQFQDGYYFTLSMKKNAAAPAEPRLSAARVHEVGHCAFDRQSQSERCDVAVTDDNGATSEGFINVRYSTESGALKMSIKATITGGPSSGKTESFERYPVKCPDNIVHDLMLPAKQ